MGQTPRSKVNELYINGGPHIKQSKEISKLLILMILLMAPIYVILLFSSAFVYVQKYQYSVIPRTHSVASVKNENMLKSSGKLCYYAKQNCLVTAVASLESPASPEKADELGGGLRPLFPERHLRRKSYNAKGVGQTDCRVVLTNYFF